MLALSRAGTAVLQGYAVSGDMKLEGAEDLAAKLIELGVKADEITHNAAQKWADGVTDAAQRRAPVLTGKLRDAIHGSVDGNNAEVTSDAVNEHGHSYAQYVELGTGRGPAQAYLYPAFAEHRDVTPYVREALAEKGIT